jgi:hypothetical protein
MPQELERVRWLNDESSLHQCWHFHWCRNGMVHKIVWRLHTWWGSWMCLQLFRLHLQPRDSLFLRTGSPMLVQNKMPHLFASDSVTIRFFFLLLCYLGFLAAGGHCNELNSLLNTNTRWWEFWTRWTRRYKSSSLTFHASLLALRRSTTAEVNETVESHNWFLMAKTIFCFRLRPAAWKPLH